MRLINYKRGYNNTFNCSIDGTIEMNREKYDKMVSYLFNNADTIRKDHEYFNSQILKEDLARRVYIKNSRGVSQGFLINIRLSATDAVVKHFNIKGHKRGNYQIRVTI